MSVSSDPECGRHLLDEIDAVLRRIAIVDKFHLHGGLQPEIPEEGDTARDAVQVVIPEILRRLLHKLVGGDADVRRHVRHDGIRR